MLRQNFCSIKSSNSFPLAASASTTAFPPSNTESGNTLAMVKLIKITAVNPITSDISFVSTTSYPFRH